MKKLLLIGMLMLASCNREERPEAPTAAESERLDEAEDMLNDLANEEGAAPEGTAPSLNQQ
jgi:hypothetical protein